MGAADPDGDCDVAVVGGGILGLAVARELGARRPGLKLTLLEREAGLAAHQSSHNSGVVHAGIYYEPGSLKARLCVEGARLTAELCERHGLPYEACGKVIVARDESELPALDELERRGRTNGVAGLRRVGRDELAEIEPHCAGIAALHSPATAITDFGAIARALAGEAEGRGATIATGAGVGGVRAGGGRVALTHARGETRARCAVFCAGLAADRLAVLAGAPAEPRIVPFRGAYLRLRGEARGLVRGLIYPVPDPRLPFLGVHLTRTVGGDVLVGPTALPALARLGSTLTWPGSRRLARRWWRSGAAELRRAASRGSVHAHAAAYHPGARAAATPSPPSPGSGRRRSRATDRSSTTSSSTRPSARSTCATRRRRAPRPRSRWRG